MPRSVELPPTQVETPEGLRRMAQRAHRLAHSIPGDTAGVRLREFAQELEARAAALEVVEVKPPEEPV
jgi:hypothetical protein